MKKRSLLMAASMLVALLVATTSTLAFLQDTAADHNIMTLGSVTIVQHEYERATNEDGTYKTNTFDGQNSYVLQGFTQNKPLVPIVGDPNEPGNSPLYAGYDSIPVRMSQVNSYGGMSVFAGKNAQDKFVTVENTGASPAYVRTLVAIEVGSSTGALIGMNYHQNAWAKEDLGVITVNGNNYYVISYVYKGAQLSTGAWRHEGGVLPAGDTTYPSLSQIYIKSKATNEDLAAIDGNGNGKLDVLVLSQAIQADGFASADAALTAGFGEANATNAAEWLGGVPMIQVVNSADELAAAMAKGGNILLNADVTLPNNTYLTVPAEAAVTLDLGGYTLSGTSDEGKSTAMITNKGTLIIRGEGTIDYKSTGAAGDSAYGFYTIDNHGELVIDGATIKASTEDVWDSANSMQKTVFAIDHKGGKLTVNSGVIESTGRSVRIAAYDGNPQTVINGGNFVGQVWVQGLNGRSTTLTVSDGHFEPVGGDGSSLFVGNNLGTNTVAINGGVYATKIGASVTTQQFVSKAYFETQDAMDKTNAGIAANESAFELK